MASLGSLPQGETVRDHLQPSDCRTHLNSTRSTSRINTFVATRPPASLHTCAAARSNREPLVPNTPRPRASCAMVSKLVQSAAHPAVAGSERERGGGGDGTTGMVVTQFVCRRSCESCGSQWSTLGSHECPVRWRQLFPNVLSGIAPPRSCWRRAANQTWARLVPAATHAAEETLTSPSTRACPVLRRSALASATSHGLGNMGLGHGRYLRWAGCLSLIIFMQSAQLDHYAATLDLTADVSPSLPMESVNFAVISAVSGECGVPRMARRHSHTAAS